MTFSPSNFAYPSALTQALGWVSTVALPNGRVAMEGAQWGEVVSDRSAAQVNVDLADIQAAVNGDDEAFRRLVEKYERAIGRQMLRFSRDPSVCAELTHDVFVQAWKSLARYRGDSPWLHWLRKIAVRTGYRFWRGDPGQNKRVTLTESEWSQLQDPDAPAPPAPMAADLIHGLLTALPPKDRLVLTLIYLDGCSMAQAADRAGWTTFATKTRAYRARNKLNRILTNRTR